MCGVQRLCWLCWWQHASIIPIGTEVERVYTLNESR
jgi:hypothetical protein